MLTFGDNMAQHPTLKGQNIDSIQFETMRKENEQKLEQKKTKIKVN